MASCVTLARSCVGFHGPRLHAAMARRRSNALSPWFRFGVGRVLGAFTWLTENEVHWRRREKDGLFSRRMCRGSALLVLFQQLDDHAQVFGKLRCAYSG